MFLIFHGCQGSNVLKMFLRPEDINGVEVMLFVLICYVGDRSTEMIFVPVYKVMLI